jgi:hypothetical protein
MHLLQQLNWGDRSMVERRGSARDRRSGGDRRRVHNLDYLWNGGIERRSWKERRSHVERRQAWLRVTEWSSVPADVEGFFTERLDA